MRKQPSMSGLATGISRLILLAMLGGAILLMADYLRFAETAVAQAPEDRTPYADAVVVFTGRSDARLATGVALLEQRRAERMLISGVDGGATKADLRAIASGTRRTWDCCIDLGRDARDTVGNARELRDWIGASGVRSIILVTDNYHMQRSRLEVQAVLPGLAVTAWPVAQPPYADRQWWNNPDAMRGLFQEYVKLMAARIRLTFRIDVRETV